MDEVDGYEIWADGQLRERDERFASADARAEVMSAMEPEVAFAVHGRPPAEDGDPTGAPELLRRYEAGQAVRPTS